MNTQQKIFLYFLASALLLAPLAGLGMKRNRTELANVASGWFGLRDIFDTIKKENKIPLPGGKEIRYDPFGEGYVKSASAPIGEEAYGKEKPNEDSWGLHLVFLGFTKFFQSLFSTLETLFGWFSSHSGKT